MMRREKSLERRKTSKTDLLALGISLAALVYVISFFIEYQNPHYCTCYGKSEVVDKAGYPYINSYMKVLTPNHTLCADSCANIGLEPLFDCNETVLYNGTNLCFHYNNEIDMGYLINDSEVDQAMQGFFNNNS